MRDILEEIWATARRNKLRTALTGFAVAWGIFMLIVLLGAGNGLLNAQESNMFHGMTNSMIIYGGYTSKPYKGYKENRNIELNERDRQMTDRDFSDVVVESGARLSVDGLYITYGDNYVSASINGVAPVYQQIQKIELACGRFINNIDMQQHRRSLVLTENQAKELLPKAPLDMVGRQVTVGSFSYLVVGVTHADQTNMGDPALMPYTTMQIIWNKYKDVGNIYFSFHGISTEAESDAFEKTYKSRIARNHDADPTDETVVFTWNRLSRSLQMGKANRILKIALWVIGIFTLLSGIVGVSNIMLISVKERTREFGIRKAIGAKPRQILSLVVVESIIITTFFGYIGMVLGIAANVYLDSTVGQMKENVGFMDVHMFLNPGVDISTCISATILMIVAGTIAGLIPARKASRTKPIEALRAE